MKFEKSAETVAFFKRHGFCFRNGAHAAHAPAAEPIGFGPAQKADDQTRVLLVGKTYTLASLNSDPHVCVRVQLNERRRLRVSTVQVHASFLRFLDAAGAHLDVSSGKYYLQLLVRFESHRLARAVPPKPTAPQERMPTPPAEVPDDLKRIRGIRILIEHKLRALGVTRWIQIAIWTPADIERISEALDFKGRIEREDWVGQAQALVSAAAVAAARAEAAHLARTHTGAQHDAPLSLLASPGRDNLQRIGGLTLDHERILNALGVSSFAQIAGWTEYDIGTHASNLGIGRGVFAHMRWREQAQRLMQNDANYGVLPSKRH